jgi:hypothetical protein
MRRRRVELFRTGLATYLLAACFAFGCARPGGTLVDVRSGPTAASESGVAGEAGQMILYPDANSDAEQTTPKTERAVGYMALLGGVLVLFLFVVTVIAVAKIVGG